jgi:hypothetical protein
MHATPGTICTSRRPNWLARSSVDRKSRTSQKFFRTTRQRRMSQRLFKMMHTVFLFFHVFSLYIYVHNSQDNHAYIYETENVWIYGLMMMYRLNCLVWQIVPLVLLVTKPRVQSMTSPFGWIQWICSTYAIQFQFQCACWVLTLRLPANMAIILLHHAPTLQAIWWRNKE